MASAAERRRDRREVRRLQEREADRAGNPLTRLYNRGSITSAQLQAGLRYADLHQASKAVVISKIDPVAARGGGGPVDMHDQLMRCALAGHAFDRLAASLGPLRDIVDHVCLQGLSASHYAERHGLNLQSVSDMLKRGLAAMVDQQSRASGEALDRV